MESEILTRPAQTRKSMCSLMGDTSCRIKADNHRESESLNASGGACMEDLENNLFEVNLMPVALYGDNLG